MQRRLLSSLPVVTLAILLSGCSALVPISYRSSLVEVERPSSTQERYGDHITVEQSEEGIDQWFYQDSLAAFTWIVGREQLNFILENNTQHTMRLIWDEAAFIEPTGSSGRVMHEGVKYIDRNNSQPPSVIPRNGQLTDLVLPTRNVRQGYKSGWVTDDLILPTYKASGNSEDALANVGKQFSVLLPIDIQGTTNEYIFTFEVNEAIIPD